MAFKQPITVMWLKGMINDENSPANDKLDENPEHIQFYGYDPDGPSPFEDTNNDVVVPPVVIQKFGNFSKDYYTP